MPPGHVSRVAVEIRPGLVVLIVERHVDVMRLQVHDHEHRRNRTGELAELVVDVLGLQRHALAEPFDVDLGGRADLPAVSPGTRRVGMERPARGASTSIRPGPSAPRFRSQKQSRSSPITRLKVR